ncbi:NAD(P)-dependent alcohol dehydrogenase [Flavobacterium sp.]|uniref:NAD(P)-dependent alcohol dehydrogenase n=1 Tax=Flavobacterium sp. TaxID=239 RepID=UPI003BC0B965
MKAIVYKKYGTPEVLKLNEVIKPMPHKNEILLKIAATAVNSGDIRLRKADPFSIRLIFGLIKPKVNILGSVFSGVIESVGEDVIKFKVGDLVFGHTDMGFGAYAEYKCLPEKSSIALKPANISHKESAVIPFGGVTALYFIRKAMIRPGQKVIVIGASGAVGIAAVQLAKEFGANVTGVCSTKNIALVKSIGADNVIDYTMDDFTMNGETYDVIFDTVKAISLSRSLKVLNKDGIVILSAAGISEMLQGIWISLTSTKKVITGIISHKAEDIIFLKELIESDKLKPVIDKTYPLEKMSEAHVYVEKGHKKGNVAIEIQ